MALVLSIHINERPICQVAIVNTGHRNKETGEILYRFQVPAALNHYEIYHDRKKPWYELIQKAIEIMEKEEGDTFIHGRNIPSPEDFGSGSSGS